MDFTNEELEEWLASKVTKEIFKAFRTLREDLVETIATGGSQDGDKTGQLTARAVGEISGLDFFIEKRFLDNDN